MDVALPSEEGYKTYMSDSYSLSLCLPAAGVGERKRVKEIKVGG
jgi:hypothetical protein